jgi:hypothetical protein
MDIDNVPYLHKSANMFYVLTLEIMTALSKLFFIILYTCITRHVINSSFFRGIQEYRLLHNSYKFDGLNVS